MINTDAIASTQKAGQGDAVIFAPDTQNIAKNIFNAGLNISKQKAQQAIQNKKIAHLNQQNFYKQLQDIKAKIWDADLDEINDKIKTDIVKYAIDKQKQGIDVFSDMPSLTELNGKLGELSALASASKSAETIHNETLQKGLSDKWINYDDAQSYKNLDAYKNMDIATRALNNPQLSLRPFDYQKWFNDGIGKQIDQQLKPFQGKVYYDSDNKDISLEIQNGIIDGNKDLTRTALLNTGRVNPEDVDGIVNQLHDQFKKGAFYDSSKDDKLALDKKKFDDMMAFRNKQLAFQKKKHEDQKALNKPLPTYVTETIVGMANGTVTKEKFFGVPVNGAVQDSDGNIVKKPVYGKASTTDNGKSLTFEIINSETGNRVGSTTIPIYNDNKEVVVSGTKVWQDMENDAVTNGFSYGTEYKAGTKSYNKPKPDYNNINSKNSNNNKNSSATKTYTIINPNDGSTIATGVSKVDADKALKKGYKIK